MLVRPWGFSHQINITHVKAVQFILFSKASVRVREVRAPTRLTDEVPQNIAAAGVSEPQSRFWGHVHSNIK